MTTGDASSRGVFHLARTYDAPAALVFRAWTEPQRLGEWWGPKGMTVRVVSGDIRPGGSLRYAMAAGEHVMWGTFSYREIVPEQRIVYIDTMTDEAGVPIRMAHVPDFPTRLVNTAASSKSTAERP